MYEVKVYENKQTIAEDALVDNDSIWDEYQQIPYTEEEQVQLNKIASINPVEEKDTVEKGDGFFSKLLLGKTLEKNNTSLKIFSPFMIEYEYNTVDGGLLSKKLFTIKQRFPKGNYLLFFRPSRLLSLPVQACHTKSKTNSHAQNCQTPPEIALNSFKISLNVAITIERSEVLDH